MPLGGADYNGVGSVLVCGGYDPVRPREAPGLVVRVLAEVSACFSSASIH